MADLILTGCALTFGIIVAIWWRRFDKFRRIINRFPGPQTVPIMGNAHQIGTESTNFFRISMEWAERYQQEGVYRIWLGVRPVITVYKAELLQTAISNNINTKKSIFYRFFYPWLKEGLLLSHGEKWQKRRKMLTSSFHYSILENFMSVFHQQAAKLIKILQTKADETEFDIYPYLNNNALDIICNTTMGIDVNALEQQTPYVDAVYRISRIILERVGRPWSYNETIFRLTPLGREHYKKLQTLHDFTRKVIENRWKNYSKQNDENGEVLISEQKQDGSRKKLVFLDLLLENAKNDPSMTLRDVQEEVDTFMFAGHDTSGSAAGWAVYNLGRHQDWQIKIREEIVHVLGEQKEDEELAITQQQLSELKVLDAFLKESMRLFTTVMAISREVHEDCQIGGYDCPKGTTVQILMSALHRDPEYFPDPHWFNPERWMNEDLPKRHSLCYLPFSAGLRNCIGQKFAQLELKIVVVNLVRHFHIQCQRDFDHYSRQDGELVLRPAGGKLFVKLAKLKKKTVSTS